MERALKSVADAMRDTMIGYVQPEDEAEDAGQSDWALTAEEVAVAEKASKARAAAKPGAAAGAGQAAKPAELAAARTAAGADAAMAALLVRAYQKIWLEDMKH